MSGREASKKELAEAGRRKLEAFRKQKAHEKRIKQGHSESSTKPVLAELREGSSETPADSLVQSASLKASLHQRTASVDTDSTPSGNSEEQVRAGRFTDPEHGQESSAATGQGPASTAQSDPSLLLPSQTKSLPQPSLHSSIATHSGPPPARRSFPLPPSLKAYEPAKKEQLTQPIEANGLHSTTAIELPVSSNALAPSFSLHEELQTSPPVPSGYAALSDSYLSPAASASAKAAKEESPVVDAQSPSVDVESSFMPVHPPSTAAADQQQKGSAQRQPFRPSLQRFANLFGSKAAELPSRIAGPQSRSATASLTKKHDDFSEGDGNEQTRETGRGENSMDSLALEDGALQSGHQSRHGRVPSLIAWNKPRTSSAAELQQAQNGLQSSEGAGWQSRGQADPPDQLALRDGIKADPLRGQHHSGINGFIFDKLPEPKASSLPSWQSQRPSNRVDMLYGPRQEFSAVRFSDGKMESGEDGNSAPLGLPAKAYPAFDSIGQHMQNGSALGFRKEASFAHLAEDDSKTEESQFAALQQHIDDLTRDKFELARGLEKQQQMAAYLAAENQRLLDDYNEQGQKVQHLRQELDQRYAEVGAQQMALAGVGGERDACRFAVQEATQRAEALAAEVVALEEKYLQARSAELKAASQMQREADEARRAKQQQAATAAECAELRTMVAALQEEKQQRPEQLRRVAAPVLPVASIDPQSTAAAEPDADTDGALSVPDMTASEARRGLVVKESEVAKVINRALQHASGLEASSSEGLPDMLEHLLPPRIYQGGASEEAAELLAEERRVLTSISGLLAELQKEKQALLLSLNAQQQQCTSLQTSNFELRARLAGSDSFKVQAALTAPSRPQSGRGSTRGVFW